MGSDHCSLHLEVVMTIMPHVHSPGAGGAYSVDSLLKSLQLHTGKIAEATPKPAVFHFSSSSS